MPTPRRITAEPPPLIEPAEPAVNTPPGVVPGAEQQGSFMAPPEAFPQEFPDGGASWRVGGGESDEEVTELTDEERAMFATLLTCGKKSETIDVMGHEVVIETLNTDDDLRVGLFAKPYLGSEAHERAWQVATVAAGIRSIGGRPVYTSLMAQENLEEIFDATVAKMLKYAPIVITEIYRAILRLEVEFAELATKLGKLKG